MDAAVWARFMGSGINNTTSKNHPDAPACAASSHMVYVDKCLELEKRWKAGAPASHTDYETTGIPEEEEITDRDVLRNQRDQLAHTEEEKDESEEECSRLQHKPEHLASAQIWVLGIALVVGMLWMVLVWAPVIRIS